MPIDPNKQNLLKQKTELQVVWQKLLAFARSRQIPSRDAEDLVSEALRKALDRLDDTRGGLLPFSMTVLHNAMKNYWRDRKIQVPFDDDESFACDDRPDMLLEEKEKLETMKRTIEQLSALLSAEELQFLKMFGEVMEDLEDRAVSETARRLAIAPAKGWNIFRKIQRKARSIARAAAEEQFLSAMHLGRVGARPRPADIPDVEACASMPLKSSSAMSRSHMALERVGSPFEDFRAIAAAMASAEGFERFLKNLSA